MYKFCPVYDRCFLLVGKNIMMLLTTFGANPVSICTSSFPWHLKTQKRIKWAIWLRVQFPWWTKKLLLSQLINKPTWLFWLLQLQGLLKSLIHVKLHVQTELSSLLPGKVRSLLATFWWSVLVYLLTIYTVSFVPMYPFVHWLEGGAARLNFPPH